MAKWANFLVSAKRMSNDGTRISILKVHEDKGDNVGLAFEESRSLVIKNIDNGLKYMTIIKNPQSNQWEKGAIINVINTPSEKFLRTDKNQTPKDNLENLPDF